MGTLCYCDEFCNRPVNPDCCSDYLPVCKGVQPPTLPPTPGPQTVCYHDGRTMQPGEQTADNCNTCTCQENGEVTCTSDPCMIDEDLLQTLGSIGNGYGWTATNHSMFWGRTLSSGLSLRTGTTPMRSQMYPIYLRYDPATLPSSFDARTKWPGWISRPQDQGWCGSSWAFSTASVVSDRYAIETAGLEVVHMSAQNLLSCDPRPQQGCSGGQVKRAWQYLWRVGIAGEDCYPYTSGATGQKGVCKKRRGTDFSSVSCDTSKQDQVGRVELYHTEPAYRIRSQETDIMYEIMTNGPVQAMMRVHQDLFAYRRGVYAHTQLGAPAVGHHSVRLLGWGTALGGRKYWLAANSWGEEWGEGGLFRIA